MFEPITIVVPGEAVGKAARIHTRRGSSYLPARTQDYMDRVTSIARTVMAGREVIDEPVFVDFTEIRAIPTSWSKRKQAAALTGEIWPTSKPDLKNVIAGVEDAMNKWVWRDDALIVAYTTLRKKYGPQPMVVVVVRPA